MNNPNILIPRENMRDGILFLVVTALCFLAVFAALSGQAAYHAANNWTEQVNGQLSVRIKEKSVLPEDALAIIRREPGVASAEWIDHDRASQLLTPWFGPAGLPEDLPLPILIFIESESGVKGLATSLSNNLADNNIQASVDDHSQWAEDLSRMMQAIQLTSDFIVILLLVIAVLIIGFATYATLLARRNIVEVLHLSGAYDSYIAGLFQRRFLGLGLRAGIVGALFAMLVMSVINYFALQMSERNWLADGSYFMLNDIVFILFSPIIAGLVAMLSARLTVLIVLSKMQPNQQRMSRVLPNI